MSAFVVHPEHINVLIWAGLRPAINSNAELTWHYGNPTFQGRLDHSTRNDIGRMLLAENVASINYRYNEDHPVPDYTYQPPQHTTWSPGELLNAIHAYEHQACEHPEWSTSSAHQFCRALERHVMRRIPGYDDGPWAIGPRTKPLLDQHKAAMLARHRR
ncbi:MAG: hypothetical protein AB7G47_20310 [Mycolicibacterium sp.]|uniref:hypothetical protein n=1 Tax=Mycolicibacterium sp. TaxID=2320850 RepID=UPI003D0FE924